MDLRSEVAKSFQRLPYVERCLLDILLSGYYRIQHTEELIRLAIKSSNSMYDDVFWSRALWNESGHAAIYLRELRNFTGHATKQLVETYVPCGQIQELLAWVRVSPKIHGAVYRAYLEVGVLLMPPNALALMNMLMPNTMRIHQNTDKAHSEDCFTYMVDHLKRSDTEWIHDINYVECAFAAELQHSGLRG